MGRGSHVACARGWVTTTVSGTPVGTQVAAPPWTTSGWPFEVTRTVPVDQNAVVQGPPAFGGNGQPATVQGAATVTLGLPPSNTRGLGAVGIA